MTTFEIPGNPSAIEARGSDLRAQASGFTQVATGLRSITTDGWKGRAADRFRDRFDVEPTRWDEAGQGFLTAAGALERYAAVLRQAQAEASAATADHAYGDQVTQHARAAYDADVRSAHAEQRAAAASGTTLTLTVDPFVDPGEPIREAAQRRFDTARMQAESAAHEAAATVRAGCAAAPASRNWLETGLAFIGGVLYGAGEAVWDLGALVVGLTYGPYLDLLKLATGELTPEELAIKHQLQWETVQALATAAWNDPLAFGKEIGKGLLDWDTWKDDPARALGHLVPDAVAAFFTGGAAAAGTRGAKALEALGILGRHADELVDGARGAERLGDVLDAGTDLGRIGDRADSLADLTKYDDVYDISHTSGTPEWLDEITTRHPELSRDGIGGVFDYTTNDGYKTMNPALRGGDPIPANVQDRIDRVSQGLSELPKYDGTTYRGVNLPESVVKDLEATKSFSDRAFLSTSTDTTVPPKFLAHNAPEPGEVPCRIEVQGHSGANIAPFSQYAKGEAEVLFDHGTRFDVVSSKWNSAAGRWDIVLREAP